jgi:hypothetical protein
MTVAAIAFSCWGVVSEGGRARQTEPRGRSHQVLRTPAVSQKQRDREEAWILPRGQAGHTADERVEVVADVEFFEQRMQQPPRQHKAASALGKYPKVIEAALLSPVVDLCALARPSRLL